jgi:hypothetical protein
MLMLKVINQLYQNSDYKGIIFEINQLYIPFDKDWNKIAVSISGGADSALLTNILCQRIIELSADTEIHFIHNIRCWKTRPWQKHVADKVIEYFVDKFKSINFIVHYNFVPPDLEHANTGKTIKDEYGKLVSGDTIELRSFAEYTCFKNNISSYYNAITKNPNISLNGEIASRNIDPNQDNFRLMIMEHLGMTACHPFRFVDKSWIMSTYKFLNLQELLSITRSCEGEFENINYKTYKPGQYVPLCNNCFWCKERTWGIEKSK